MHVARLFIVKMWRERMNEPGVECLGPGILQGARAASAIFRRVACIRLRQNTASPVGTFRSVFIVISLYDVRTQCEY